MTSKQLPGDMRIVAENEYRAAVKTERLAAKELAENLAEELGVDADTAVACSVVLECPIFTPDWTELELPGKHCWTAEARKQQFAVKVAALRAMQK